MGIDGFKFEKSVSMEGVDVERNRHELQPGKHFLVVDGNLLAINERIPVGDNETRFRFGANHNHTLTGDAVIKVRELPY